MFDSYDQWKTTPVEDDPPCRVCQYLESEVALQMGGENYICATCCQEEDERDDEYWEETQSFC